MRLAIARQPKNRRFVRSTSDWGRSLFGILQNPIATPIEVEWYLKSFTLTFLWNLAKPVKISLGTIPRLHHTDQKQMVLLRE